MYNYVNAAWKSVRIPYVLKGLCALIVKIQATFLHFITDEVFLLPLYIEFVRLVASVCTNKKRQVYN